MKTEGKTKGRAVSLGSGAWLLITSDAAKSRRALCIASRLVPRFLVCIVKFVIHVNYTNVIEP